MMFALLNTASLPKSSFANSESPEEKGCGWLPVTCAYLPECVTWCTYLQMCEQNLLRFFFVDWIPQWGMKGVNKNDYVKKTKQHFVLSGAKDIKVKYGLLCYCYLRGLLEISTIVYYFNIHGTLAFTQVQGCPIQITQPKN